MKGIIFNAFESFIDEVANEGFFDEVVDSVTLESDGIFVGPGTYPDGDLLKIVLESIKRIDIDPSRALFLFGKYLFGVLQGGYGHIFSEITASKDLFVIIDSIIHVEVRKLMPGSITPKFTYELTDTGLKLIYDSPRQLWDVAHGLMVGAIEFYKEEANVTVDIGYGTETECLFEIVYESGT